MTCLCVIDLVADLTQYDGSLKVHSPADKNRMIGSQPASSTTTGDEPVAVSAAKVIDK